MSNPVDPALLVFNTSPNRRHQFGTMEFYGHSLTYGGSSDAALRGSDGRIAAAFPAEDYNRTKGGAILAYHETSPWSNTGNGGWAHIYRFTERDIAVDITEASYEGAGGYEAKRDYCQLWFGINDVARLGIDNLTPFTNALEAVISRLRSVIIFENTDASVTYPTGVWTQFAGGTEPVKFQSGSDYHSVDAAGGTIQIAVPASFPGGVITLGFLCGADGGGGRFAATVDGQGWGAVTTTGGNAKDAGTGAAPFVTPKVLRLKNLTPGAHTIVVTVDTVTTSALFDCWWIEGRTNPLIMVPLDFRHQGYGLWGGWPYHPVDADITTLNNAIQAVVSGFDSDVQTVETDSVISKNSNYFVADQAHLNDWGHALIAFRVVSTIALQTRSLDKHAAGSVEPPFISRNPWNTARNTIEAVQPDQVPFRILGRNAGDHSVSLLQLFSQGLNAAATLELGRLLGAFGEMSIGVAAKADQIITGTQPGDVAVKVDADAASFFLGIGQNPFLQARYGTAPYQTQGVQAWQALIALSRNAANYARLGVGRAAEEAQLLQVAANDQGFVGSLPGDTALRSLVAGATFHIGVNLTEAMKITEAGITFMQSVYDTLLPWTIFVTPPTGAADAALKVGGWSAAQSASQSGGYLWNNSSTQNDEIGWDFMLAKGTWSIALLYFKTPNAAIATVNLDGVSVGTVDMYAAANTFDQTSTIANVVVGTNGKHRVSLKAATRNASSVNWQILLSGLQLRRTA